MIATVLLAADVGVYLGGWVVGLIIGGLVGLLIGRSKDRGLLGRSSARSSAVSAG